MSIGRLFCFAFAMGLLTLPWLNPVASGPAAATVPWLVAGLCAGGLMWLRPKFMDSLTAAGWLVAAVVSVVFGLIQYAGSAWHFTGWINSANTGEAFANLRQRNQFASLTSIGMMALLYLCRSPGGIRGGLAGGAFLAAVLLGVGNAASSSRTGLLQWVVLTGLFAIWGVWRLPDMRRLWLAALGAYGLASLLLPWLIGAGVGGSGIWGRISEFGMTCQSRWIVWDNVLTLIAKKPWFGWGWGELDYAHFVTLYPGAANARFCDILDNAHNLPLHLAVELGVPFAVAVCLLLAGVTGWLRPWRDQNPARQLAWAVLLVIGLHSLLEYPLWYGPFQIAVGLCILILWQTHPERGLATASGLNAAPGEAGRLSQQAMLLAPGACRDDSPGNPIKKGPIVESAIASLAIFIIAFVSYALWDYHRISQIYLVPSERSAAYRYNTLEKIRGSWLFQNHVQFAELTTTAATPENAAYVHTQAQRLLHFSPEARVVEKLIDSALLLGLNDEAIFFKRRFELAFPEAFGQWQARAKAP